MRQKSKAEHLMPGLPSTKANSALYCQLKPCSHQYFFSLPSFGCSVFSADSQTTKLVGADWPAVSLAYCLRAVFVGAPVSPCSPRQMLELLARWKSACVGIVGSCCILSGSPIFILVLTKGVDYGKIIVDFVHLLLVFL